MSLAGAHKVVLQQKGENEMNYAVAVSYFNVLPDSSPDCSVSLSHLSLRDRQVSHNELLISFIIINVILMIMR